MDRSDDLAGKTTSEPSLCSDAPRVDQVNGKSSQPLEARAKTCSKCGKLKPVSGYYPKGSRGVDSACKDCVLGRKARQRKMKRLALLAAKRHSTNRIEISSLAFVESVIQLSHSDLKTALKDFTFDMVLTFIQQDGIGHD